MNYFLKYSNGKRIRLRRNAVMMRAGVKVLHQVMRDAR